MMPDATLPVIDVVAGIIEQDGKILLARRDASGDQAGLWEFPGGKVEAGESQPEALVRELQEELAIETEVDVWVACHVLEQPQRIIRLHAWRINGFRGEITLRCHSEIAWVAPLDAFEYSLAPADIPLLEAYCSQVSLLS